MLSEIGCREGMRGTVLQHCQTIRTTCISSPITTNFTCFAKYNTPWLGELKAKSGASSSLGLVFLLLLPISISSSQTLGILGALGLILCCFRLSLHAASVRVYVALRFGWPRPNLNSPFCLTKNLKRRVAEGAELIPDISASPRFSRPRNGLQSMRKREMSRV